MAPPGVGVVVLAMREDGPDDAHVFVGDGDQGLVITGPAVQGDDPLLEAGSSERLTLQGCLQGGTGALGEKPA